MNQLLATIQHLIESTVLEYELLQENDCCGFPIMVIRCNIRNPDLSSENQYFIAIRDVTGPHCVDWCHYKDQIWSRLEIWEHWIEKGKRDVVEYSFPTIFPTRKYILKEIEGSRTDERE